MPLVLITFLYFYSSLWMYLTILSLIYLCVCLCIGVHENVYIQIVTIILPVVPNDCESWSLTLREKCRLRVFENRILMWTFRPKRNENGEWRRLHKDELNSLYRSSNLVRVIKSRILKWAEHGSRMEEGMSAFKILTGKPIG